MSQELLKYLNKLHDQSLELAGKLKFNSNFEADGMLVCLYGSLIELAGGVIVLIEKDRKSSLSAVFRTFLEGYVDFKNLIEDSDYVAHCMANHHQNWMRLLKSAKSPNEFLQQIADHDEFEKAVSRHEKKFKELKDNGFQPLKVFERFQKAGMEDEYRSVYWIGSSGSHNDIQALIGRHLELKEDKVKLAIYKENKLEDYLTYLDSTSGLLMDATAKIHERLKSGFEKDLKGLSDELVSIRSSYTN